MQRQSVTKTLRNSVKAPVTALAKRFSIRRTKKKIFEDKYEIVLPCIGKGSEGAVYKAFVKNDDSHIPVAAKIISKASAEQSVLECVKYEIQALKRLSHKNIIAFHESFENSGEIQIVMEFLQGEALSNMIRTKKNQNEVAKNCRVYIAQIAQALLHCKEKGVIHTDVKPSNVLISEDIEGKPFVKLLDFGFSSIVDLENFSIEDCVLKSFRGTLCYMAPEIIKQKPYNYKIDSWSFGVLIYELVSLGFKPFAFDIQKRGSKKKMLKSIMKGKYVFQPKEAFEKVPEEAKALISSLLKVDQNERIGPEDVLKFSWLKDVIDETPGEMAAPQFNSAKLDLARVGVMSGALLEFGKLMDELSDSDSETDEHSRVSRHGTLAHYPSLSFGDI